jgi:hypothetical protein
MSGQLLSVAESTSCQRPCCACDRQTYAALNALAGHYNSFGTTAPLPKKRLERLRKVRGPLRMLLWHRWCAGVQQKLIDRLPPSDVTAHVRGPVRNWKTLRSTWGADADALVAVRQLSCGPQAVVNLLWPALFSNSGQHCGNSLLGDQIMVTSNMESCLMHLDASSRSVLRSNLPSA